MSKKINWATLITSPRGLLAWAVKNLLMLNNVSNNLQILNFCKKATAWLTGVCISLNCILIMFFVKLFSLNFCLCSQMPRDQRFFITVLPLLGCNVCKCALTLTLQQRLKKDSWTPYDKLFEFLLVCMNFCEVPALNTFPCSTRMQCVWRKLQLTGPMNNTNSVYTLLSIIDNFAKLNAEHRDLWWTCVFT